MITLAIIILINLIPLAQTAPSGSIQLDPDISADNYLVVSETEIVSVLFTNTAGGFVDDLASIIQYITVSAAVRNPLISITDATMQIHNPDTSIRVAPVSVATVKETSLFVPPGPPTTPSETVDLYTWSLGPPSGALINLTDYASEWDDSLRVLRPQETLNLTFTVTCEGEGDSISWFFFRATEAAYTTGNYPTDITTIPANQRMNLYYSKLPGPPTNPTYWLPLHNSYDPYDGDISSGHIFDQTSWNRDATNTAYAKTNKIHHQSPNGDGEETYSFHLCGLKFEDINSDGNYIIETERVVSGVTITLLGADQQTPAELYYPGSFDYADDHTNPLVTGEGGHLSGQYCFNLDNVSTTGGDGGSATYTFYIEINELGSTLTTPSILGPITLTAGEAIEERNSVANFFGNRLIERSSNRPRGANVGGILIPANKLLILIPLLTVGTIVGAVSIGLTLKRKRRN